MNSMSGEKLKGVPYTGTLPATLTGTKAGYLHRYKVYGNVGENLFDFNRQRSNTFVLDSTKYIYGARSDVPTPQPNVITEFVYNSDSFTVLSTGGAGIGFLIEVKPNTTYTMSYQCNVTVPNDRTSAALNKITSNGTFGTYWAIYGDDRKSIFTTDANTAYVYLVFRTIGTRATYSDIMLVEGSTPPESYIPYEGCGERTENWFDKDATDTTNGYIYNAYLRSSGNTATAGRTYIVTEYIPVISGSTYTISRYGDTTVSDPSVCFYDGNHDYLSGVAYSNNSTISVEVPANAEYLRFSVFYDYKSNTMLNEGSTPPSSYIPFGYKLPLTSGSTPVDIYIGDDTLSTEEYIDSGTGKIYHMVGGVLTPVDPPVPFPQIPTTANSTTISWAGSGLAPSQFDSIQEWVDIPTYTRVNGEWVADNSN